MKKIIIGVFIFFLVLIGGSISLKNIIAKRVLEFKLTELNKGKVDIGSVELSLLKNTIVLHKIDITSRKDGYKNFMSIEKFSADYDIYFKDKKVLISNAIFEQIDFMTLRGTNGHIDKNSITTKDDFQIIEYVFDKKLEERKNDTIRDLEELIEARSEANLLSLQDVLKTRYTTIENSLNERKKFWKYRLSSMESNPDYRILKQNYSKIVKAKNIIELLRLEKELKNTKVAFINLAKDMKETEDELTKDFDNLLNEISFEEELKIDIQNILDTGEFIVNDLDSIVNFFLNEIYGEKINILITKYRGLMRELELRIQEDEKIENEWEFFIEDVGVITKTYGISLNGNIKNISSRLSRNLENINLHLVAQTEVSQGEINGYVNLGKMESQINIKISNFDFSDLQDLISLQKYVVSGQAGLDKTIILTKDNVEIFGDIVIHNMNLNGNSFMKKINSKIPVIKNILLPLLKDINSGEIHYDYNSFTNRLDVNSNLSEEFLRLLNDKNSALKKQIAENMLREGKITSDMYYRELEKIKDMDKNYLLNILKDKIEYYKKIEDLLNKYNIKVDIDTKLETSNSQENNENKDSEENKKTENNNTQND